MGNAGINSSISDQIIRQGLKAEKQRGCPVCKGTESHQLFSITGFPYFTVPVIKSAKEEILIKLLPSERTAPLNVAVCKNCCHCYLEDLPDGDILNCLYSRYYNYPSALKGDFHPSRDNRFLSFFDEVSASYNKKKLRNILEVGCYDGYILYHLQQRGFCVTGCDPSDGADIGNQYGVNVLKQFFNAKSFLESDSTFDAVISRHFIEHVIDPVSLIEGFAEILNPEGILFLETPNVHFYLEKGLIEVFSLQHLQGFSPSSLEHACREAGLNPLKIEETPDNIIVAAVKGSGEYFIPKDTWCQVVQSFNEKLNANRKKMTNIVSRYVSRRQKICLWGAGGFGLAAMLLYEIPQQDISFIIDSDPSKWGMEYLHNDIPIISPDKAREQKPDIIIIASMYSIDIERQIATMNFGAAVLTIFPDISVYEPVSALPAE